MNWGNTARNFIILMVGTFGLLGLDLYFYVNGQETFSETIWILNEKTLAVALFFGILAGHLVTVPKKDKK